MRMLQMVNRVNELLNGTRYTVYWNREIEVNKFYLMKDYYTIVYSSVKLSEVINHILEII